MTLSSIVDELRLATGEDETELSDADALKYINRAYWGLLNRYPFKEAEETVTFDVAASTALYELPTDFSAIRLIAIENPDTGKHTPLNRMTPYEYEKIFVNPTITDGVEGFPTSYVREAACIRLYPTPDEAYTMTLKYWKDLSDLASLATAPNIPRTWHEILLTGAVYRRFMVLGDFQRANAFKAENIQLIDSAVPVEGKEEFDTHLGGVDCSWRLQNYV